MCFIDLSYDKKVDTRMENKKLIPIPVSGCSPEMADAIANFNAAVTPSHTLRSRRYSLWTLVSTHIDAAAESAMKLTPHRLSERYSFSEHAKRLGCNDAVKVLRFFNKKHAVSETYYDFETLVYLLYFIKSRDNFDKPRLAFSIEEHPFCELCWRFTVAFDSYSEGEDKPTGSIRYCTEHIPSSTNSCYRNDHRHRESFKEWLRILGAEKVSSPSSDLTDQINIRKKAYNFSHAKLTERRIKILKLYAMGLSQAEIARQLGITRQAVSKSLYKLRGYFSTWVEVSLTNILD